MKTDIIRIPAGTGGAEALLSLADRTAAFKQLPEAEASCLRLLAEEMLGMMRAVTGEPEAEAWIEDRDGVFEMHLRCDAALDEEKRQSLLSVSTGGVNEATRSLAGRILAFFEIDGTEPMLREEVPMNELADAYDGPAWSMEEYRGELCTWRERDPEGARTAWDELEKTVIGRMADEVKVFIRGRTAEMTVFKKF